MIVKELLLFLITMGLEFALSFITDDDCDQEIELDIEKVGLLVGKGGRNLRKLEKRFPGTFVKTTNSGNVVVYGHQKAMLEALVEKLKSEYT